MFLISTRLSLQHTEILDYRFPRTCTDVLLSVLFQKPCLCHHAYQLRSRKSPKFPWHVRAEIGRRLFREKNPHRAVNPFRPRKMSFATRYPRDLPPPLCSDSRFARKASSPISLAGRCKCWSYCPVPAARSIHLSASLKIPLMRDEICIRSHFE